ncbi:hypothetical protein HPB50_013835 [Hyalomma asiaticum]|uniref:Uncharacterized protein n=1 Tax=Hyalomma asiaticum TaxID=266040 RepID=A0ACB7SJC3_HYAAI|nr:hypothetical protein HPB50_013835 [Hyalomma asiaticum]
MPTSQPSTSSAPTQVSQDFEALIEQFARLLYKENRDVFQSVERVERCLRLADTHFLAGDSREGSLFRPCTHEDDDFCWLLHRHQDLNAVLVPHGFEMLIIHEDAFALQTIEHAEDILTSPDDLFAMCICNWLLRAHWCITTIVLNVATVARFHAPLFWRLLSVNVFELKKVELIGLPTDESHFRVSRLFEDATELSEIVLVHIRLSDDQAKLLSCVLAANLELKRLVLKYVHITAQALKVLNAAISEHGRPTSFELCEEMATCDAYRNAVARLLDTPVVKLCLDAPCNWKKLFKRLRRNKTLYDLELVDCDSLMHSSLTYLADALLENSTLTRLKLSIRFPRMNVNIEDHWCKLTKSVERNQSLKSLSLASTRFCEEDSLMIASLAEAIAQNKTLVDISVEDCDLSLTSLSFLLDGLARNENLRALNIGELREDEQLNRSILDRVVEMGLEERVDCSYVMKSDWVLKWTQYECERTPIRRVKVLYTSPSSESRILSVLHLAQDTLTYLHLEGVGDVRMSTTAAISLVDLLANSNALEHVTLLFDADDSVVVDILSGLASSRTIYSVIVGRRWNLSTEVMIAFVELLQKNTSISELALWQDTPTGYEEMKRHLMIGIEDNFAIQKLRLLYGPERKESRAANVFVFLQNNRSSVSCVADVVLGHKWIEEGLEAFIERKSCDNLRRVLREATGCTDEALDSNIVEAINRADRLLLMTEQPDVEGEEQEETYSERIISLRKLCKDFIEQAKVFLEARKREDKPPRAPQSSVSLGDI